MELYLQMINANEPLYVTVLLCDVGRQSLCTFTGTTRISSLHCQQTNTRLGSCLPRPHPPPVPFLQGKELLSQKIPVWQQACAEPNKLPDRAMFLAQQMSGAAGAMTPGAHHPGLPMSEPIPGAKPLPVPPELAALRAAGALGQQVRSSSLCMSTSSTRWSSLIKKLFEMFCSLSVVESSR